MAARYIDANKIIQRLNDKMINPQTTFINQVLIGVLDREPTADVVEVETIKSWLYSIAINNVGINNNGDFSDACEEIISRLDGLRRFAKERSSNE